MDYLTPILNAVELIRLKGDLNSRKTATFRTYENPNEASQVVYTPINGLKLTAMYPPKNYYVIGYMQVFGGNGYYLCSDATSGYDALSDLFWVDRSGRIDAWTKSSEDYDELLMAVFRGDKDSLRRTVNIAIK